MVSAVNAFANVCLCVEVMVLALMVISIVYSWYWAAKQARDLAKLKLLDGYLMPDDYMARVQKAMQKRPSVVDPILQYFGNLLLLLPVKVAEMRERRKAISESKQQLLERINRQRQELARLNAENNNLRYQLMAAGQFNQLGQAPQQLWPFGQTLTGGTLGGNPFNP